MSKDKRRSIFGSSLSAFTSITPKKDDSQPANLLRKRRTASFLSTLSDASAYSEKTIDENAVAETPLPAARPRPPLPNRGTGKRASSVFGSLTSKFYDDEPLSATSTRTSMGFDFPIDETHSRHVLQHGEVQTSSSMFRKKREHLVLTETHLIRFKSQAKASEAFPSVPSSHNTTSRQSTYRHSHSPSTGSAPAPEAPSFASDASGDRDMGTPLRHIVAVFHAPDGGPYFALDVYYLDDETNQASSMTLQFGDPDEMRTWMFKIRFTSNNARLNDANPLSAYNSHLAARVVEAERDYVPPHYAIYKVVLRESAKTASSRASSDDLSKLPASVCFLAIGVHKVHLIPLFKPPSQRSSSPSLASLSSQSSHGILALTECILSEVDDTFQLTFRKPLEKPKTFHLASLASHDIAVRLRSVEEALRPEWESRPYHFGVPESVKEDIMRQPQVHSMDQDSLDRTLIGYCLAYGVQPENISYQVTYPDEDSPRFELLQPIGLRRDQYTVLELLAVMRALRYNETFAGISFKDVHLDILNGLFDDYGHEHVCTKTKRGTHARMDIDDLSRSSVLVQEIRALALTNRKLRRMDFSNCIKKKPKDFTEAKSSARDSGCGIVEALFPLCKYQTTNVDWIALNGIQLGETDLDYLVAAAVERDCHLRALEMSRCGLTDRALSLVLDSLRPQENTLEALNLSANPFRLSPTLFDSQIGCFAYLTKLDLSHVARTSGPEPLISVETLNVMRLQELCWSGTSLNAATIDAIAGYLINTKQSKGLRELKSMTDEPGKARDLHLDVSENYIEKDLKSLTKAIASGHAPTHLTIRLLEFEEESDFRKMIQALSQNKTIRQLDISRASLPSDASEETCQALEQMFAGNDTLEWLDMSGEDSRLETTKLGVGVNRALQGLQYNKTLRVLYIRYQKLGVQGASTLADVLKTNSTLQYLYCEMNDIALNGFTDLVNSLHRNTTLLHLPTMQESRQMALKRTEDQVKQLRDDHSTHTTSKSSVRSKLASKASKVTSKTGRDRGPSIGLSDQDIKAALGLVDESWSRQEYRLQQYLQRNHDIANGLPVSMDVGDEDFERNRPDTASSLSRVIEQVTMDSTPTMEKDLQLGASTPGSFFESPGSTPGSTPGLRMAKTRHLHAPKVDYFSGSFTSSPSDTPNGTPSIEKDIQVERTIGRERLNLNLDVTSLEKEIEMSFAQNRDSFM
ncbi:leucine rich repeat protein-like protein [Boeremia exigua]|uniref:leucine rich repeat protein-like protein n=1 Tax=Boeremia exigua TaxID=749465 RepID=UPI001E8DBC51|nr:leucine rich repeat protein-like protein [Boeremia exigua]KAH6622075.1 leucine rich repeat protein-like protein [Boeremia exigua]